MLLQVKIYDMLTADQIFSTSGTKKEIKILRKGLLL